MLWGVTLSPTAPAGLDQPALVPGEVQFELCRVRRTGAAVERQREQRIGVPCVLHVLAPPGARPLPATSANGSLVTLPANRSGYQPSLQSG